MCITLLTLLDQLLHTVNMEANSPLPHSAQCLHLSLNPSVQVKTSHVPWNIVTEFLVIFNYVMVSAICIWMHWLPNEMKKWRTFSFLGWGKESLSLLPSKLIIFSFCYWLLLHYQLIYNLTSCNKGVSLLAFYLKITCSVSVNADITYTEISHIYF